ncbi:MAG: UDP-N-acetylmuramate--L-alanine ligase [Lachnospiraceae bacterium]
MYKIDFENKIHVHFIGIGGVSMSGLAAILLNAGFTVSGSDQKASRTTDHLETLGASVYIGQRASNITDNIDLVVYTAAIHPDNPEYMAVIQKQIPHMSRAVLLGQIMANYQDAIAVAGTHGKTTTTSMLAYILLEADLDPTISVGGNLKAIDGNIRVGHSQTFLTEACEYTNSFHEFYPTISIILNIEEDHMDFFHNLQEIEDSFKYFAERLPDDHGLLVINGDMDCASYIVRDLPCHYLTFGINPSNDYYPAHIQFDELGNAHFDVMAKEQTQVHIDLSVPGTHNITNALAAVAAARSLDIPFQTITEGLRKFSGADRRFEYKGKLGGITVIDDYAHHPTEIKTTLQSALKYPHDELWTVFQPHTYTRTKAFLHEFADALSLSDHVILTDIYAAREQNPGDISSKDILTLLQKKGCDSYYFQSFDEVEKFILENCKENDLLITMGAGDVVLIGEKLLGL